MTFSLAEFDQQVVDMQAAMLIEAFKKLIDDGKVAPADVVAALDFATENLKTLRGHP